MAGTQDIEAGKRLRHFRTSFEEYAGHGGLTRFAKALGLSAQAYYNAEAGIAVSKRVVELIVTRFPGMTEDYIRRGVTNGLSLQTAERLGLVGKVSTEGR